MAQPNRFIPNFRTVSVAFRSKVKIGYTRTPRAPVLCLGPGTGLGTCYLTWSSAVGGCEAAAGRHHSSHRRPLVLFCVRYREREAACAGPAGRAAHATTQVRGARGGGWLRRVRGADARGVGAQAGERELPCRPGRRVGPEVGPTSAFYGCIPTVMHGPITIFWAAQPNSLLDAVPAAARRGGADLGARAGDP